MMSLTELRAEFERPTAHSHFNEQVYGSMTDFDRTKRFHTVMGLQVNHEPIIPTVEERILRAKLLLEETIETIQKGLGLELHYDGAPIDFESAAFEIVHPEGRFYDAVETLDGLADVKVIAEGTAVAFGLPLEETSYEVYCSNMTKLDGNGNPIINGVTPGYRNRAAMEEYNGESYDETGFRADSPVGKLLKSEFYVPANIARVILDSAPPEDRNRILGVLEMNRK